MDVCALLTAEDVKGFLGVTTNGPEADDPFPPFFGCSWEGELPSLSLTVVAWPDEEQARASMDLFVSQPPKLEGLGDEAFNTQPVNDVSVRQGRYEVSVDVLAEEGSKAELDLAVEIARVVIVRLP